MGAGCQIESGPGGIRVRAVWVFRSKKGVRSVYRGWSDNEFHPKTLIMKVSRWFYFADMVRWAPPMCRSILQKTFVQKVRGQFQPCTSAQTNPTPDETLTLTITLLGARGRHEVGRGSHAAPPRVLVFFPKNPGGPKGQPRPIKPAYCTIFCAGCSCT